MINGVKIIELPNIKDPRGNLSFFENHSQIPFEIKKTYWIYGGQVRKIIENHAFKESHEFIVALSGSFDIILNNGEKEQKFSLNKPYSGLFVPNLIWRRIENFSNNSLALVVSSKEYESNDYIMDFDQFKRVKYEIEQ